MDLNQRTILHLGCGRKADPNAVNVDCVPTVGADVVHNLDQYPWPFAENQFKEVWAYDVIEHLDNVLRCMEEIHRVCQHDAIVKITVPHFSSSNAYTDITHRHYFSRFSFDYFTDTNAFSFYTERRFAIRNAKIIFRPSLMNKIMWRLANKFPTWYEQKWTWIFPAWFLYFELTVIKG